MTTSRFTKPAEPKLRKTARKPTTKVEAAHITDDDAQLRYAEAVARAQDEYLRSINVPSHTRLLFANVARLITFSATFYWGLYAMNWLMIAAIAATGSGFIAFVAGLVTALMAIQASWNAGSLIADFITDFNVTEAQNLGRDLRVAAAKRVSLVKGWFKREETAEAQHA